MFDLKALVAGIGLALSLSAGGAHAGAGDSANSMENVSNKVRAGTIFAASGGKVGIGPFTAKVADRETEVNVGNVNNFEGKMKDVHNDVKVKDIYAVGAKVNAGNVTQGRPAPKQ